jgi:hypothetical protein
LSSTEEVMRTCAQALGNHLPSVPDGETGDRSVWTVYQAYRVFHEHPDLITVQRPEPVNGVEQWMPTGFHNLWNFRVREGVDKVAFEDLKYAAAAKQSYETFRQLRSSGTIPPGVRFQVCLPTPESIMVFFREPGQLAQIISGYVDAMEKELQKLLQAIPHEDLLIQWDVCSEVLDIEGVFPWALTGEPGPEERYEKTIARLSSRIPDTVQVGYHLCYADLGHKHMKEPEDLGLVVQMANRTAQVSGRRADYFHMPVPRNRTDEAYFGPLKKLAIDDATLFLGLVHYSDGLDGARHRIDVARKFCGEFGISTECGFGRRPPEQVPKLLELHKSIVQSVL